MSDKELADTPFYRPSEDSEEMQYLAERRRTLGGFVPQRRVRAKPLALLGETVFEEFYKGSGAGREVATTMVFVRLLRHLMSHPKLGRADRADRSR